jgi:hypothetical protein
MQPTGHRTRTQKGGNDPGIRTSNPPHNGAVLVVPALLRRHYSEYGRRPLSDMRACMFELFADMQVRYAPDIPRGDN